METVLSPKSICNNCAAGNKGSLSWGPQGFISYGSHNIVNIVHAHSVKLVQSLENHASMVVKTAWKPPEVSYSAVERPVLLLASADLAGQVVIWDIVKGSVVSTFQDAKKNIKDLHWISPIPHNDVILVVHTNVIAAWSLKGQNCSPLWTQSFNDVLQFISPQQLSQNRLAVVGSTSIFTFYNFDYTKEQGNTGNNLVVLSQKGDVLRPKYLVSPRDDRAQSADLEQCSLRDCIEFIFHPFYRDHGVLMFSRDIFIFDLELGICISNISLDKHGSSFSHVFFCVNANEFVAVHDSGQLSFRQIIGPADGKSNGSPQNSLSIHNYTPVRYTLTVQTDALRLSRQAKPLGAALEPMGERQVAVIMSSGRLYIWKLDYKLGSKNLGFSLNGLYSGHGGGLCCMRMAPGFATGDLTDYKPLVAMGSQTGNVQVINLSSGILEHDFAVSPLPIVCIDWAGSNRLVCAAVIGSSSNVTNGSEIPSSNVKNELHVVSLPSGRVVQLKSSRNDGSAIQMVTCSPSGSLAVVIYGSGAVDIWDVDTSHVVRSLSVQAASAQWARRRMHRSASEAHDPHDDPRMSPTHTDAPSPNAMNSSAAHDELIVISISGRLLRFVFAGKSCQEKALNFDVHVSTAITSLAWKGRYIVAAELDGRIVVENIIEKRYNTISTNKNSAVKRLVFSPGRRNYSFLALYADGSCDLCNAETGETTNSLRVRNVQAESAQGGSAIAAKAIDADFWAPGIPVLAMSTGAVRVLNFDFKFDNSPVINRLKNPGDISPYLIADGGKQLAAERLSAVQTTDCNDLPIWLRPYEGYFVSSKTLPQRCAKMARILGNEMEYHFWLIVDYYLNGENGETSKVPLSLGFFSSDTEFKEDALDSLRRQISLAETSKQRRRLADILGCYGDQESAAAALLASQNNDPLFIQDWLKACLIDASVANNTRTATMKLVATNLLADGHIFDGIHLLCLVDLHHDACRYLQSSGFWIDSIKLAKCTLPMGTQRIDVIRKFVQHMATHINTTSTHQRLFAVLLLISNQQFRSAIELLLQFRWTDLAGRLAEAVVEKHGLSAFTNTDGEKESKQDKGNSNDQCKEDDNSVEGEVDGEEQNGCIKDHILEVATAAFARLLADHRLGQLASAAASRCSPERYAALVREIELLCEDDTSATS